MKRIAASVGLVAIGTSALQAQDAGAISAMQGAKPWNASVSLRGFYDDNINSERHDKNDSFGFEINPTIGLALVGERTSGSVSYTYSGKWYDERPEGNSSNWDHTHIFSASVQHAFSSRTRLVVGDQFVIGQEPDVFACQRCGCRSAAHFWREHPEFWFNHPYASVHGFVRYRGWLRQQLL
jgi:hypothetical protein